MLTDIMTDDIILTAILEEEEDRMTGYETIIIQSPRNSDQFDLGHMPGSQKRRGASVVRNPPFRPPGQFRSNTWNVHSRNGVIIEELDNHPRIVEITDDENDTGIANPDYPTSEADVNGRTKYPSLPVDGQEHPERDYGHETNEDGRQNIRSVNLKVGDEEPSSVAPVSPAPPVSPPLPEPRNDSTLETIHTGTDVGGVANQPAVHPVLRRVLEKTEATANDDQGRGESNGEQNSSREIYTQTRQQQSAEVQTTPERPPRSNNQRRSEPNRHSQVDQDVDFRSRSHETEHRLDARVGPRFQPNRDSYEARHWTHADFEDQRRSSTLVERIIITREIDPDTGRAMDSMPMSNINPRPHIVYNPNILRGSGRTSRGWTRWSPRDDDGVDVAGIVAGMDEEIEHQFGFMPGERASWMGRTNHGYNVSPERERRHQPDVVPSTAAPADGSSPWLHASDIAPPPYTERDLAPSRVGSASTSRDHHQQHGWTRSHRSRDWREDSDHSSSSEAGWTRRTRVVFAVMLLLCVLLLLALIVVVTLYFTAGPGSDCLSDSTCDAPPLGYIIAFSIIGVLAFIFMFIGVLLCFLACRLSRERRTQRYPVSGR